MNPPTCGGMIRVTNPNTSSRVVVVRPFGSVTVVATLKPESNTLNMSWPWVLAIVICSDGFTSCLFDTCARDCLWAADKHVVLEVVDEVDLKLGAVGCLAANDNTIVVLGDDASAGDKQLFA